MADIETALAKIRPHTTSSLAHQKAPAQLLQALESTFEQQATERSPTAYFAALLTTLDSTLRTSRTSGALTFGEGDVLPAELYLLALVLPFVPHPVIRSNLSTILSLTAPLFPSLVPHAPPLRSQLAIYNSVYLALERSQLESAQGLRQSFASILHLTLDPRPKVRKKAAELIRDVLAAAPPPSVRHPYAAQVADFVLTTLTNDVSPVKGKKKGAGDGTETGIHILALLGPIVLTLPPSSLPSIAASLIPLPQLGNPYLSHSAFTTLSVLLTAISDDDEAALAAQLPDIISAIHSACPLRSDTTVSPAWTLVLARAFVSYKEMSPGELESEFPRAWKSVWDFLESTDRDTRKSAAEALDLISGCFSSSLIEKALSDARQGTDNSIVMKIVTQIQKALDSLTFARSIPELLSVVSSTVRALRHRGGMVTNPTAAEILMPGIVKKIGALRTQKNFEYKEDADRALGAIMGVIGPKALLEILPLNLEPSDRAEGREPRAFLLPLLTQPHPSPLNHFISYFVPLTERMFDYQQTAETEGRASEAKVWSALVSQIWNGLPGYCHGTVDLKMALTTPFSQLLSQLIYRQEELRPAILKALKAIVDSNVSLASEGNRSEKLSLTPSHIEHISQSAAQENIAFLKTQADSWLAVLFNVFGTVERDDRGKVGDVIKVWAGIAKPEHLSKAFAKVAQLFKQNLAAPTATSSKSGTNADGDGVVMMTQDLLQVLLPYLGEKDAQTLFELSSAEDVLENKDTGVQKRGYKILSKLVESGKIGVTPENLIQQLEGKVDGISAAAKKDRLHLLALLVGMLPDTSLHLLPSLVPEAVLGTKEPSEKARLEAFELIVTMGKKMKEGGVVKRNLLEGMDEGDATETPASLEEYFTMIAGGLAGATPHMISATITAISRLVFEFKDDISSEMSNEIFTTIMVFLDSANREIVKSALGFVKLAIHTYPTDVIREHLKPTLKSLLGWSHGHKNHFKMQVRYICERLMRKVGYEELLACVEGDEDGKKILANIKKRKEHAKKKKAKATEQQDQTSGVHKPVAGSTFEDVLYGDDPDSDAEEGEEENAGGRKKRGDVHGGARLRIDNDQPMDLLESAVTQVTSARSKKSRKPGQEAARFKADAETGKMIIDDGDEANGETMEVEEDVVGTAYRDTIRSVDGFSRGPNGRVKFNKDTKKRRREELEGETEDIEMGDVTTNTGRRSKKLSPEKLGKEFRSKKAGGDVKRGGMDPYAYVTLQQAAKKKSGRITNRR